MAYYDRIARQWHRLTGSRGGPLKELVLNERIIGKIGGICGSSILELGAGNGYLMPMVLSRFSGQVPARIVVTDQSAALLEIAKRDFRVREAEYTLLDVRGRFAFPDRSFDLVLACMLFNEIGDRALMKALRECWRVLGEGGRLVAPVTHPSFVRSLARRQLLRRSTSGVLTMPGAKGMRLPVVRRSLEKYKVALEECGFDCDADDVFATEKVLAARPALRRAGDVPIVLLLSCNKLEGTRRSGR